MGEEDATPGFGEPLAFCIPSNANLILQSVLTSASTNPILFRLSTVDNLGECIAKCTDGHHCGQRY